MDSAILDALRSNFTSPPGIHVPSAIVESQGEVDTLEVQIRQLRAQLQILEERRDVAQGRCLNLKSLSAPIRRLPSDILLEIFSHTLWYGSADPIYDPFPLLLTHVCSYWRHLALSTPTLWSSIRARPTDGQLEYYRALWNHFLLHSGTAPLSLFLDLSYVEWEQDELLDQFVEHSRRWKAVGFTMDSIQPLRRLEEDDMNQLQSLALAALDTVSSIFLHDITCFRSAHALVDVSLGGYWDPSLVALPWGQLTTLSFGSSITPASLNLDIYLSVLRHCTQLARLEFNFGDCDVDERRPSRLPGYITLPKLRSLSVEGALHIMDDLIFEKLGLPGLTEFIYHPGFVSGIPRSLESSWKAFQSCAGRSRCKLSTISLTRGSVFDVDVIGWLDCLQSAREVTLDLTSLVRRDQKTFIEYFSNRDVGSSGQTAPCKFPSMQRITIHGLQSSPSVIEALVSMARFRCRLHSPESSSSLETPTTLLFASFGKQLAAELEFCLRDCVAAGLTLHFHSPLF
ncbi:hypothetical protein JAAARDRAFT_43019 [Jaapia argillacea MUCL 33604]|uniref:Uncharacterized protein n=1 Tax=Jaapia argillacea MUCL 33604 TaxID=933084 RepID=A0A067P370_9AGAM|nr:hypothetical protein JAAARDRAFT_43019 [Jaapia argillacea MUCL 33604]